MVLMKNQPSMTNCPYQMKLWGIGLVKISDINSKSNYEIIHQKGIGIPLIQDIMELCKKDIKDDKQGNSVIAMDDFTLFIYHFQNNGEIFVLIYMDENEYNMNFSRLYLFTKRIDIAIQLNKSLDHIISIFDDVIIIPKIKGIVALFIIGSSGSLYFSKINKDKSTIAEQDVNISGFISALFSFSGEIMSKETGAKLKEINFGDRKFYMIIKNKVIFAYLVKNLNPLIQRYMYLIADEFLVEFKEDLKKFNGNVVPFRKFEEIINQYFII